MPGNPSFFFIGTRARCGVPGACAPVARRGQPPGPCPWPLSAAAYNRRLRPAGISSRVIGLGLCCRRRPYRPPCSRFAPRRAPLLVGARHSFLRVQVCRARPGAPLPPASLRRKPRRPGGLHAGGAWSPTLASSFPGGRILAPASGRLLTRAPPGGSWVQQQEPANLAGKVRPFPFPVSPFPPGKGKSRGLSASAAAGTGAVCPAASRFPPGGLHSMAASQGPAAKGAQARP